MNQIVMAGFEINKLEIKMKEITTLENLIPFTDGNVFIKIWNPEFLFKTIPLFLFHDSLGCVEMWRNFPANLANKMQIPVIAYDRLGFGQSSIRVAPPSLQFIDEEAEIYFPHIIESLGIKEFSIFGHSVGGAMAVACAAKFKLQCQYIITESAQAFVEEKTKIGIRKAQVDFMSDNQFRKLEKFHKDKTKWVLDAWINIWLSSEFSDWNLRHHLMDLTCPVLAIHGDRDEYGSNEFPKFIVNNAANHSKMVIVDHCGHAPHKEHPEFILNTIKNFAQMWLPNP